MPPQLASPGLNQRVQSNNCRQALGWAGAGQARLPDIVLVTDSAGGSWVPGAVRDNSHRCLATVCGKPSGGLSRPQPHPMEMFLDSQ